MEKVETHGSVYELLSYFAWLPSCRLSLVSRNATDLRVPMVGHFAVNHQGNDSNRSVNIWQTF